MDLNNAEARTILAHTLYPNANSEGLLGFIQPVAEIIEDKLVPLNSDNFCPTMKVFITGGYDELEERFPNYALFKITIGLSKVQSENLDPSFACKYVAHSKKADQLKPKEFFEVLETELPESNNRRVEIDKVLPGTRYIFIDDSESVYGPFKWSQKNDNKDQITLEFIDGPLPGVNLEPYQIYKVDRNQFYTQVATTKESFKVRRFLQNLSVVRSASFYDYASDEDILRFVSRLASVNGVRTVEKNKFDAVASQLAKIPKLNVQLVKQRLARLPHLVTNIADVQEEINTSLAEYLKGEHGRPIVTAYVEKNQSQFLDVLKKEREAEINALLEAKREEIKTVESRLRDLNDNKIALSVEVERIRRETKQEAVLDSARAEADKQLQQKRQELANIEKVIAENAKLAEGLVTLASINAQIEEAEQNRNYVVKRELQLKNALSDLQKELHSTEEDLRKKLTGMKPYVDAINGAFTPEVTTSVDISVRTNDLKPNADHVVRQREIVSEVQRKLHQRGRPMQDWQIANLLISTQQSFITFFAGLPGVGKTSLARLLPEVQGISARLQEVAVARGWTSQKDLIGFYNPLTNRFQQANTGMHSFLRAIAAEKKANQAMAYALLDEANLSPIEHYWSCFMGMTDGERGGHLLLGQEQVAIPSSLRFIATINYDGTTEPLSQRIVDRSPIIVIEPSEIGDFQPEAAQAATTDTLPIAATQMDKLFGNEESVPELEQDEKLTFDRVRRTLLDNDPKFGRPLSISPRKELAIRQYCSKARGIMNAENEFLALDVAILQHILPQVRGNGPRFGKRLEELYRELQASSLQKSADFVSRMITNGEIDLHTYDFFCW